MNDQEFGLIEDLYEAHGALIKSLCDLEADTWDPKCHAALKEADHAAGAIQAAIDRTNEHFYRVRQPAALEDARMWLDGLDRAIRRLQETDQLQLMRDPWSDVNKALSSLRQNMELLS